MRSPAALPHGRTLEVGTWKSRHWLLVVRSSLLVRGSLLERVVNKRCRSATGQLQRPWVFFFDAGKVRRVEDYLGKIADHNINVIWLGPFTEYSIDPSRFATKIFNVPQINFVSFSNIEQQIASIIKGNSKFQYMPFNALYLQNEKAVLDDCLIWRDADHFSICGEDIIAKKSNWGSLNHLIRVKK